MCLAVPGVLVAIDGSRGVADFDGLRCELALDLLPEVQLGDFVLAHAGFAIQKLERDDAEERLELLRQLTAEYADSALRPVERVRGD